MGIRSMVKGIFHRLSVADEETSRKLDIMDRIQDAIEEGSVSTVDFLINEHPQYATEFQKKWLKENQGGEK